MYNECTQIIKRCNGDMKFLKLIRVLRVYIIFKDLIETASGTKPAVLWKIKTDR